MILGAPLPPRIPAFEPADKQMIVGGRPRKICRKIVESERGVLRYPSSLRMPGNDPGKAWVQVEAYLNRDLSRHVDNGGSWAGYRSQEVPAGLRILLLQCQELW